jgi:hypothetical protein
VDTLRSRNHHVDKAVRLIVEKDGFNNDMFMIGSKDDVIIFASKNNVIRIAFPTIEAQSTPATPHGICFAPEHQEFSRSRFIDRNPSTLWHCPHQSDSQWPSLQCKSMICEWFTHGDYLGNHNRSRSDL